MKRLRYLSLLLAVIMLFTALAFPINASAVDLSGTGLTTHQKYFFRVLGSLARADYYENDILASMTLAQAIYEGGWGCYSLPVGGNNLFGIKAFNTWTGKVYDQRTHTLYNSYEDFMIDMGKSHVDRVSAWRAHDNWTESVKAHSSLFHEESKYSAVVGEKDYKTLANAIVAAGYCSDNGYADTVIDLIEQYGMTEYDVITPDSDGVVAITAPNERVYLQTGDTYTVSLAVYPSDKTPSAITWKSENTSVATVDKNGVVTAKAHGTTLISATLANGREACCIVYVDCNAVVIDSNVDVYTSTTSTSTNGKISRGNAVKITSDAVYTNSSGKKLLAIKGYNSKGTLVSGYALAENIYRKDDRKVTKISLVKNDLTLKVNDKYTVRTVVSPADAVDTSLTWASSNSAVASVSKGVITAKKAGTAVITATAVGGKTVTINVTVASAYREYPAVISAYETVNVRSQPSASSSTVGKFAFISSVTVIGEPTGKWYKVKGASTSGTTITGYVDSAYVQLLEDGATLSYGTLSASTDIYESASASSLKYGTLSANSDYAVLKKLSNNWYYVVGLKTTSSAVCGYAQISEGGTSTNPPSSGTASSEAWYGRTTSKLNVRNGAGSSYTAVGQLALGATVVITGEENGWYKVSGTSTSGTEISGYSSADYIKILYSGVTTSRLNLRSTDSTSGSVVKIIESGTSIVIVGEKLSSGWYAVEVDGYSGYCSGDYVTVKGKLPAEAPDVPVEPEPVIEFSITNPAYSIKDNILWGVASNTTAATFLSGFTGKVKVVNSSGTELASTEKVGTGCVLYAEIDGAVTKVATVVVKGDTNGDGALNVFDALYVKRAFLGSYTLSGVYLKAALVSGRSELTVIDYAMIKRAILGNYEL